VPIFFQIILFFWDFIILGWYMNTPPSTPPPPKSEVLAAFTKLATTLVGEKQGFWKVL